MLNLWSTEQYTYIRPGINLQGVKSLLPFFVINHNQIVQLYVWLFFSILSSFLPSHSFSLSFSFFLSFFLSCYRSIYLSIYLSMNKSLYLFISPPILISLSPFIHPKNICIAIYFPVFVVLHPSPPPELQSPTQSLIKSTIMRQKFMHCRVRIFDILFAK